MTTRQSPCDWIRILRHTVINVDAMMKQTVFVVDDDEAMRDSLKWLLESAGIEVVIFSSAEEFLENLAQDINSKLYALNSSCLVTDVCMPGMSGLALQDELIRKKIQIPIIIITGHGNEAMAVQVIDKGAIAFINKPFNDDVLLDQIQCALDL